MDAKQTLISKTDQVSEIYSRSPIIKGLISGAVSLVPFLGEAITTALDARAAQLSEENSRRFAEETRRYCEGLDESKFDRQFIESNEFVSLLSDVLIRNAKTHEQEKVLLYARIFVNASTMNKSQTPYKEGFVQIIDALSVDHIRILGYIYQRTMEFTALDYDTHKDRISTREIAGAIDVAETRGMAYCDQMIRFGLLKDRLLGRYMDYEPGFYEITDYGKEFAEFLSEAA